MTEPRRFNTKPAVPFAIDDEEFHVLGAIPAEELAQLLDLQQGLSGEGVGLKEQFEGIKQVLQFTMLPESWDRFVGRLADRSRPVDFNLLLEITNWLSGDVWSARPTQPQQPSTEPSEPDGGTSTGNAATEESTPLVEVAVVDSPEPTT